MKNYLKQLTSGLLWFLSDSLTELGTRHFLVRRSLKGSPFPWKFSSLHQPFPAATASLCAIKPATLALHFGLFVKGGNNPGIIKNDSNPNKGKSFKGKFLKFHVGWFLASSLIPSPKSIRPRDRSPALSIRCSCFGFLWSHAIFQPCFLCHLLGILSGLPWWLEKLEDIFRNICITSPVELWSFRSWQWKFTFKQHRGSNHMAFKGGQGWTASISLVQFFGTIIPSRPQQSIPGPRKEGRQGKEEGIIQVCSLEKKCLSFKNSPNKKMNKKNNITPKTSNKTQNPPMLGSFHSK